MNLPDPHPTNYFVPNFGMDNEVKTSLVNTAQTESNLNYKWNPLPKDDAAL